MKRHRLANLQDQLRAQAAHAAAMVGGVERVLVPGRSPRDPGQLQGRTVSRHRVTDPGLRVASRLNPAPTSFDREVQRLGDGPRLAA